jgi:hypothetical protein
MRIGFELPKDGAAVGRVDKKWMSLRDTCAIEIEQPAGELVSLGIVLAIDYVKRTEQSAAASAASAEMGIRVLTTAGTAAVPLP